TATNEEGWMWALDGTGQVGEASYSIKAAFEVGWSLGKEMLHDAHRLGQPIDSDAAGVERHAGVLVLRLVPAGADADLQAPIAQLVEGRQLLREHHRMPQVVVEDERTEPQARGDGGRDAQRGDRRELIDQVVRQHEGRVPEPFHVLDGIHELRACRGTADPGRESEWFHVALSSRCLTVHELTHCARHKAGPSRRI